MASPPAVFKLNPAPVSMHGLDNRGIEAGSIPGVGYGRFGRMFDFSQRQLPDDCLVDIAKSMIKVDISKSINEAEAVDENPTIPSGYTYFGQFIDHDISLDPTPLSAKRADIAALEDFRTPALDLDCIYGRGPDDQPYMYSDGLHLRLGKPIHADGAVVATKRDVLRLDGGNGKFPAILGDKRNDENRIVSQIQSVFIAFHNKVVDDAAMIAAAGGEFADSQSRFRTAAMLVRWHYQWLVVNDFLPRIVETGMVAEILNPGGSPRLDNYDRGAKFAYMPVEFAGAAYRFGHSMVRPGYALNKTAGSTAATPNRIAIFNRSGVATDNLNGFGVPMPDNFAIDWSFFLDGLDHSHVPGFKVPQPSYRIDASLVDPLGDLPEFRDKGSPFTNLAYRNLARGVANLRLPSGEQVARALGLVPLAPEILWSAGSKIMDESKLDPDDRGPDGDYEKTVARRKLVLDKWVKSSGAGQGALRGATPLWYYILREAEYFGFDRIDEGPTAGFGGHHLGPVGSRIVVETFIGLLWHDTTSYLRRWPGFAPMIPHSRVGFKLADLFKYALA